MSQEKSNSQLLDVMEITLKKALTAFNLGPTLGAEELNISPEKYKKLTAMLKEALEHGERQESYLQTKPKQTHEIKLSPNNISMNSLRQSNQIPWPLNPNISYNSSISNSMPNVFNQPSSNQNNQNSYPMNGSSGYNTSYFNNPFQNTLLFNPQNVNQGLKMGHPTNVINNVPTQHNALQQNPNNSGSNIMRMSQNTSILPQQSNHPNIFFANSQQNNSNQNNSLQNQNLNQGHSQYSNSFNQGNRKY